MNDAPATTPPRPVPYADPSLPVGPVGFEPHAYPMDFANRLRDDVTDDGMTLSFGPQGFRWMTFGRQLLLAIGVIVILAAYLGTKQSRIAWTFFLSTIPPISFALFVLPYLLQQRRPRAPYITVDREKQIIRLPREAVELRYEQVVRLQHVKWAKPNTLAIFADAPTRGWRELQIVFNDNCNGEQAWCLCAMPEADTVKRFAEQFHAITGIPVALVRRNAGGEFVAEALDGHERAELCETSGRPRGVLR